MQLTAKRVHNGTKNWLVLTHREGVATTEFGSIVQDSKGFRVKVYKSVLVSKVDGAQLWVREQIDTKAYATEKEALVAARAARVQQIKSYLR